MLPAIRRAYRRAGAVSAGWYGGPRDPDWRDDAAPHPTVNLPLEGSYERETGATRRTIDASRVVWFRPGEAVRARALRPGPTRGLYVQVHADLFDAWVGAMPPSTDAPGGPPAIRRTLDALDAAERDPSEAEDRLLELVITLLDGLGPPARPTRAVRDAQAWLAADPAGAPGPAGLAPALGLSRFALCRQFRAATGRSVLEYREDLRLVAAIGRLRDDPDADLATLAADLGFASHSHFTARFRRRLGVPPRTFVTARRRPPR